MDDSSPDTVTANSIFRPIHPAPLSSRRRIPPHSVSAADAPGNNIQSLPDREEGEMRRMLPLMRWLARMGFR